MTEETKQVKELRRIIEEAYKDIKQKKLDRAIVLYPRMSNIYNRLSNANRELLRKDFKKVFWALDLHFKISEAYTLAQMDDMFKLGDRLRTAAALLRNTRKTKDFNLFSDYATKQYKYLLNMYKYRREKIVFDSKINKIRWCIKFRKINEAIAEYNFLLKSYYRLLKFESYDKQIELYSMVEKICKDLILFKSMVSLGEHKPIEAVGYEDLRRLLERGRIDEASALYKQLENV